MALVLRFGPFELDAATGELRRGGLPVKLQPQPAKLLAYLAGRPGQLVTREELQQQVWGDESPADVDQALNFAIKQIRAALGDDAGKPRYIETVPRRGYRFMTRAPVSRSRTVGVGAVVALALVAAGWFAWQRVRVPTRPAAGRLMLAVLPFENLSGDPSQEYLSDGLTEEMIGRLAMLSPERVGVIARTSVLRYRRSGKDVGRIGRELGVQYALEGSVRRAGDRVRISAQLIDVSSQAHRWAATYERKLEDVLSMETEVAQAVAQEIRIQLRPGESRPTRPLNPEAYEAYLKGRYYSRSLTGEGVRKGIAYFEEAIRKDPGNAPAYAGLAVAYYGLSNMHIEPAKAMSSAKAAASKALELDGGLAEAHVSLAMAYGFYDWDWRAAEREFSEAIRLNPGSADAHAWYGTYLALMGRLNESTGELEQARRLDPLSLLINNTLALPLYFAGRYDQAIEQARKTLELDPGFYIARVGLGSALAEKGEFGKAIAEFERARQLDDSPEILAFLARTYAVAGKRAEARRVLGRLLATEKQRYVSPYDLALVYEGLGDRDQALRLLERAYQTRAEGMVSLKVDPRLAGLRAEPAFQELVRRMDFPP